MRILINNNLGLNLLSHQIHQNNLEKGFYEDNERIEKILGASDNELLETYKTTFFAQRIALIHSEASEALEGDRKDLQDDHLPQYKSKEVELADALIRILDLAGYMGMDVQKVVEDKLAYNATRPHKHGKKI